MNEYQKQKRSNYIKKLVSNSRAVLTNQITIPLGVVKMNKLITWIGYLEPIAEIDLSVFDEYYTNISALALGTERLQYNNEFLKQQDQILDQVTLRYKDQILDVCREIIDRLADDKFL